MIREANNQKGVSLILTIFVMVILLAVVLFISLLLYTEVRNVKNLSDSVTAFFAADSGVEKVLYYDRNVLLTIDTGNVCDDGDNPCPSEQTCDGTCKYTATRGLCTMGDAGACQEGDTSLACNGLVREGAGDGGEIYDYLYNSSELNPDDYLDGCDPGVCNACQVSFDTELNDKTYHTVAKVYPSADGAFTDFDIKSRGSFERSSRRVEVHISSQYAPEAITIINACATPISAPEGGDIKISAEVHVNILGTTIGSVYAIIKNVPGSSSGIDRVKLEENPIYGAYTGTWSTNGVAPGSYYVDIEVTDTQDPVVTKIKSNIPPYPQCIGQ